MSGDKHEVKKKSAFSKVQIQIIFILLLVCATVLIVGSYRHTINGITNNMRSNSSKNTNDNSNFRGSSSTTEIAFAQHPHSYSEEVASVGIGLVIPPSALSDNNNDDNDPCSSASMIMGTGGDFGVMYVIAGDADYAETFLPVVGYLRDTLKIPNALERRQKQQQQTNSSHSSSNYSPQLKYALVTEPHLCRDVFQDIVSFFDIVVTIASKKDSPMVQRTAHLLMPDLFQNPFLHNPTLKSEVKKNKQLHPNVIGNVASPYIQQRSVLFWSKSIKVTAMAMVSPFKVTIFNDSDNIPVHADYDQQMWRHYHMRLLPGGQAEPAPAGEGSATAGGGPFDIAAIPINAVGEVGENRTHDPTRLESWLDTKKWVNVLEAKDPKNVKKIIKNNKHPMNLHSSRFVLLNMTSSRTRKFLDRYRYEHVHAILDQDLPIMDQPSFGKAALSMHLDHGNEWKHLNLDKDHFCTYSMYNQSNTNSSNRCIFVHKYRVQ